MQRIEPKTFMGVSDLIDITDSVMDRYALLICSACADDRHEHCLKADAAIKVGGETITGKCVCTHGLIPKPKKGANNAEGSND